MASRSWNRIELIGNLTRDPELRYIPSGTAVATFGIATNRTYVSEGEKKEEVDFHRVVAWGKLAELVNQLLKKGSRAFISGRMQYREWETQDGQKRRDAEVVMEDMILLTPKGSGEEFTEEVPSEVYKEPVEETPKKTGETRKAEPEAKTENVPAKASANETVSEDDLPF